MVFLKKVRAQPWLRLSAMLLVLTSLAVQIFDSVLAEVLRYDRDAIIGGQLWRLFSGHLVHLSWTHLALNIAGLLLLVIGFGHGMGGACKWELVRMALLMLAVSLGLLVFNPELEWYVGLSGILHGLGVLIAVDLWRRGELVGLVLLVGLLLKVGWEQFGGGSGALLAASIGGSVIVDAHLYGLVTGIVMAAVRYFAGQIRRNSTAPEGGRK